MAAAALLLVLLGFGHVTGTDNGTPELTLALQRVTSYLENAYRDFILDGLVGYRFLKDWINGILKKRAQEPEKDLQWQALERIEKRLAHLIEQTMESLKQTDGEYVKDFEQVMKEGFWKLPSSWAKTDPALIYHGTNQSECFPLTFSNMCIMNVLGSSGRNASACNVPAFCKSIMTQPDCYGYSLSHQVFYFMIANQKGCTNKLFKEETEVYKHTFCANMMKFNEEFEKKGYPIKDQDLFLENIMFCGMSGFSDFLKPHWLKTILSWQDPQTGCFGKNDFLDERKAMDEQNKNHRARRVKRREKSLTDGCLCHKTSVAVGALAAYVHTLEEPSAGTS